MEVCSGEDEGYILNILAWSGCNKALLGLRMLGVGEGIGDGDGAELHAIGDGDTLKYNNNI